MRILMTNRIIMRLNWGRWLVGIGVLQDGSEVFEPCILHHIRITGWLSLFQNAAFLGSPEPFTAAFG